MGNKSLIEASERVIEDLLTLKSFTADENGAHRVAWTPTWKKSRDWLKKQAEALGATVTSDSAGNLWAKVQGESEEAVVIGSHIDSVPNGGWLDGALGVLVGLEVIRSYQHDKKKPAKTIYIVDWADEEGARYGYSCLGSSAASGTLDIEGLRGRKDSKGITFEEAISDYGLTLDTMLNAKEELTSKNIKAYLELHIKTRTGIRKY